MSLLGKMDLSGMYVERRVFSVRWTCRARYVPTFIELIRKKDLSYEKATILKQG